MGVSILEYVVKFDAGPRQIGSGAVPGKGTEVPM